MAKELNLIGQKFGHLTALEKIKKRMSNGKMKIYYRCKCDLCGNDQALIGTSDLTSGRRTTCRCSLMNGSRARRKDLTGQKFGKLTVLEMLYGYKPETAQKARTYCRCQCDCGNETIMQAYKLTQPGLHSCGCASKEIVRKSCGTNIDGQRFGKLVVLETLWDETPVKVKCKCDCGNEVIIVKRDVVSRHTQSCGCLHKERTTESNTKDFTNIVSIYGIKLLKPAYQSKHGPWIWECECHCGKHFKALPANIISGKYKSCGCLNKSSGEMLIENYLSEIDINFKTQITFEGCRYKNLLKFDFAIYDNEENLISLIEYDGQQHYMPVDFFGGEKGFEETRIRDEIKNEYCKRNNIPLYRITYELKPEEIIDEVTNIIYA